MEKYVGFYWTLPINWAGFRDLPDDVEAAAAKSKTVRYQMHRARQWASEEKARQLVGEFCFIEVSPDRGTEFIRAKLDKARALCDLHGASLLYVRFQERLFWRNHNILTGFLRKENIDSMPLSPDPIKINGRQFDIIEHFSRSREKHREATIALRATARGELLSRAEAHFATGGTYASLSEALNQDGIKGARGGEWTSESVRKSLNRLTNSA